MTGTHAYVRIRVQLEQAWRGAGTRNLSGGSPTDTLSPCSFSSRVLLQTELSCQKLRIS